MITVLVCFAIFQRRNRWFKGWAASYVRAVPIHPSQVIVQETEDGSIRVRLSVYQTVDLDSYFQRFGEFSWVD